MDNHDTDWQDEIDTGPDENDADLLDEDRIQLVKCPSCGKMISEFAQQCPYCHDWVITSNNSKPFQGRKWWWIALAVIGIAMFVLYYAL